MPVFSAAEKERIRAAVRAHADAGKDLTYSGYGRAAGITRETVHSFVAEAGLPVKSGGSKRAVPTEEPRPGSEKDDTPGETADTNASIPTVQADDPRVERLVAEVRKLPAGVAAAVTDALNQRLPAPGRDPGSMALKGAQEAVTEAHITDVAANAKLLDDWDKSAGMEVRKWYLGRGMQAEFPMGPTQMVNVALVFWWANRGQVSELRQQVEELEDQVADYAATLDVDRRRAEEVDKVWKIAFAAAMAGHPLPQAEMNYLIRLAGSIAANQEPPAPLESPPGVVLPPSLLGEPG